MTNAEESRPPRLLIIDDNQGIHQDFDLAFHKEFQDAELQANVERVFLGEIKPAVGKPAYELEHALSGMDGLQRVRQSLAEGFPFQLAFVDIRMPGIDGVETVERIWQIDPRIQVVICTAYADYSWDDLARRLGHTDKLLVLKKPFDYIEVIQMASTLTEKWYLARQAALKLEQMELLVAQRTQKLLELQRTESERLRELDQVKLRFFRTVSQELRTPLTLILGPLAQMAAVRKPDGELQMMRRNAEHLLRMVNQLSDFHRLETGDLKLEPKESDLVAFLRGVAQIFAPIAALQKVELNFQSSQASRIACFDAGKIETILFNVLSHALTSTPGGGRVSFQAEFAAEVVEIRILDGGRRMSQEAIARVLDPFGALAEPGRLPGTEVSETAGSSDGQAGGHPAPGGLAGPMLETGSLGLALAQKLAQLHGGTLAIENAAGTAQEQGCCFVIRLPLTGAEGQPALAKLKLVSTGISPSAAPEGGAGGGGDESGTDKELPLVLLVEDNTDLCLYIAQGLGTEYRVLTAASGELGLDKARENVPDLIIGNATGASLNGIELCRRLKSDQFASHIPVILLGTDGSESAQVSALDAGADDYVSKPFSLSLLRARVGNLLHSRRQLHERFSQERVLQPRDIATNQVDADFLRRTNELVEKHLSDFEFDVEVLAQKMFMSRRQLFRKLKGVTGFAPNVFIRNLRLERAAQLLKSSGMTVTEITYAVGFSDLKHFRTVFRERFGVSPADYGRKAE